MPGKLALSLLGFSGAVSVVIAGAGASVIGADVDLAFDGAVDVGDAVDIDGAVDGDCVDVFDDFGASSSLDV